MEIGEKDVPGSTVRTEIHFAAYLYSIKTCNVFTPSGPEPSAPPLLRPLTSGRRFWVENLKNSSCVSTSPVGWVLASSGSHQMGLWCR